MVEALAAVMPAANAAFELQTVTVDDPQPGEVLVEVKAVGVCHTDLIMVSGAFGTSFPAVFGHEGAGVVAAVGAGVTKVAPGDKVLITFNSCGECSRCENGDPAYCEQFTPLNMACARGDGSSRIHVHGKPLSDNFFGQSSFASMSIASERNVVKLAPDADLAALAPLGCGIQTGVGAVTRSLEARAGQSLVVIGGGAVGLSALLGGRIAGCSPIILVEPQEGRRAVAIDLGADHTIDPTAGDLADAVRAILPKGADLVVDTSGHTPTATASLGFLATKAKLALVGVPGSLDAVLPVPIVQWITSGGTVRGVVEGDSDPDTFIPELIAHANAGWLPYDRFVTTYPVAEINRAIEDAHAGRAIKVVLTF